MITKNLFGEDTYVGTARDEVRNILEKFPAADSNTGLLLWLILKERHPWVAQLPAERQGELRQFLHDAETIRRRRQEFRSQA